jgi:hypothetical protein
MRRSLLAVLVAAVLLGACARSSETLETEADIVSAIKGGTLGQELAERAVKTGELWLSEQQDTDLPYRTFCFYDYGAGYTVMLEGERLVLLCTGWGGGCAESYRLERIGRYTLLRYEFLVGSGISRTIHGQYILGTGSATWQTWP